MFELQIKVVPRVRVEISRFVFDVGQYILTVIAPELVRALEWFVTTAGAMDPAGRVRGRSPAPLRVPGGAASVCQRSRRGNPDRGAAGGPPPGMVAYCEAREAFTKEYAWLVVVHFGDEDVCNPEPPSPP
jgi:hypothetical protein